MVPESKPSVPELGRRRVPRVPVVLAVELSSAEKPRRCGVTRNASGTGLLIVTPSRFAVGERLALSVHVTDHAEHVEGRVVRVEENPASSVEMWRYKLAVELDDALSEEALEALAARARPTS